MRLLNHSTASWNRHLALGGLLLSVLLSASPAFCAKTEKEFTLTDVVRETVNVYYSKPQDPQRTYLNLASKHKPPERLRKPAGVFVTLSSKGKTRACWGSIMPEQRDIVQSVIYATIGALTKEYRFAPIRPGEIEKLKPQVTLVRGLEPIHNLSTVNPMKDGLMVRSGSKSAVILPGEAKDAYFQMIQCKLKAGIKSGEPFQMYRIKADVFQ